MWFTKDVMRRVGMENLIGTICVLILLATVAVLVVPGTVELENKETAQDKRRAQQDFADRTIDGMSYIKDPRTDKCFALGYREGQFASVSCEGIPAGLLTTARVKPVPPSIAESESDRSPRSFPVFR